MNKSVWRFSGIVWGLCICLCQAGSLILPLWPDGVPGNIVTEDLERQTVTGNEVRYSRVCHPTLEVFLPDVPEPNAAVLICPGGGYGRLAYTHEGTAVAQTLNQWGILGAVLKYRLPDDAIMTEKHLRPLQDAQRALQMLHEHADQWHLDRDRIGIMGFSAGGHLAASAATHFTDVLVEGATTEQVKPDFSLLIYPVISMTETLTHSGSRTNLLGPDPSAQQIRYYSNELQVTGAMSPVCLVHSQDDRTVKMENTLGLYEALRAHHVPAELHLLANGGHGYGIRPRAGMNRWLLCLESFLANPDLITTPYQERHR